MLNYALTLVMVSLVDHLVNNVGVMQNFLFEDAMDTTGMVQIWVSELNCNSQEQFRLFKFNNVL